MCTIAAFVLSLSAPPSTLAHNGAAGIIKDRMGKFEASEKATKRIEQAFSRGDTTVVIAEAKFLVSRAREMQSYFPENSNQSPSEAKVEIWHQWDDFVVAIQSYDKAEGALIYAAETRNPIAIVGAFKEIMRSCKSCHRRFRED